MFVKATYSQAGCFHYAGHARTAEPLGSELPSGVANDTFAGSCLVFRFVTHIRYDWIIHVIRQNTREERRNEDRSHRTGNIGRALSRKLSAAGNDVRVANSRGLEGVRAFAD